MAWSTEIRLVGAGGEPVDLKRTLSSHGLATLPPMKVDEEAVRLEATLRLPDDRARTVSVSPGRKGHALVEVVGRTPGAPAAKAIEDGVRHVLRLDEDLSGFYGTLREDPELSWVTAGAGRMIRSQSVFEEVVKTICTTNVAWSATTKMVSTLVEQLGTPAPGAPKEGPLGRAFPTAAAMASVDEDFYRRVVRTGYRAPYFKKLAVAVAEGSVDLERLGATSRSELADEDVMKELLALPGVGPYAAAHIMMMIGRYSLLILDSWTRPTYARLVGKKSVSDAAIERRFKRYGRYAGLAFWLFLTRGWVADD
jgi:3-methyladenine DNA glycosylase/8-oxoguanine DNA glycosylase